MAASEPAVHRDLAAARDAYNDTDDARARARSREAHAAPGSPVRAPVASGSEPSLLSLSESGHNEELKHRGTTLVLRGALSGVNVSLMVITLGDVMSWPFLLPLNFSLLTCWAAYSACNEVLELWTYRKYYDRERAREMWELQNFAEGEVEEMVTLYTEKGLPPALARSAITAMATVPAFFVDLMMLEELQMTPPPPLSAADAAVRVGGSTLVAGSTLPLVYAAAAAISTGRGGGSSSSSAHVGVLIAGTVALGCLGSLRASITHQGKRQLAAQTCALGAACVLVARFAGLALRTQLRH